MAEYNLSNTTTTTLDSGVDNFSVSPVALDNEQANDRTTWDNANFEKYNGYYLSIPEYQTAINAFATWCIGKGWKADNRTTTILDRVRGWGEDTFNSILWNMLVMKKVQGDAYAEIIEDDDGNFVNLKPLGTLRHVVNGKGILTGYEQINKGKIVKFKPEQILHLCNNRIGDQIHGTSITSSVQFVIDCRNEAMTDWRRILHRSTIRVIYIDSDDTGKIAEVREQYKEGINLGEVLLLPGKKGDMEIVDLSAPSVENFLGWIKYLENFFYQALGVPKVILGGSEEFTEASSKIGYLTFEQIYSREIEELKADLWNQLGIMLDFNKPASLKNEMLESESKNTGQTSFQPNDMMAGSGK